MNTKNNNTVFDADNEFELLNLANEYSEYSENVVWAVITSLSEPELRNKYRYELKQYEPFVVLTTEQGETMKEFNRNNEKYKKRALRHECILPFDDRLMDSEMLAAISRENVVEKLIKKEEREVLFEAINTLSVKQKRRVYEKFFCDKTSRQIAKEEGVNYSNIDKSIELAIKKMRKFIEKGGAK